MALVKDIAVVLRRLDYSETSQVLVVFTRERGQQRVIARGIKRATKKKASTGIDLLEMGTIVFTQRPGKEDVLATLSEWRQVETFSHLWLLPTASAASPLDRDAQTTLARLYAAQYAAEVTAQLTEVNDPHPALFDALVEMLRSMVTAPPLDALVHFLWAMLREIGLVPELSRCMRCGNDVADDRVLYFSSREGGTICRDCEPHTVEKRRVDPTAAHRLASLTNMAGADRMRRERSEVARTDTEAPAIRGAFDLLDYHLTETMGKPARLQAPLLAALRTPRRA